MDFEDSRDGQGHCGAHSANPAMSIIGAEDEDFENDLDPMVDDNCTTFNSIELLKNRPTHLLVFLQHVMLQFDCAPVLCYLHADVFRSLSAKETKKHFVEFYNNFLDKGAILRVNVPPHVCYELDRSRPELIPEDQQKKFAQEVQNVQTQEVLRQLDDFRQKRMMGMTPNEQELLEVENHHSTDRIPTEMKEKAVAENLLDKMADMHPTIVADEDKCSAIFASVLYYMKHLGVKTRATDSKKSRGFFRKRAKKEEPKLAKPRGGLPSILREAGSWIGGGSDKDKGSHERKGSSGNTPSRGAAPDASSAPFHSRKSGSTGSSSQAGSEVSEASNIINISITSSPDSEIGLTSSRSDSQSVSEGGEVSPASQPGACLFDSAGPTGETTAEESQDKDRYKTNRSVKRSQSTCVERRPSRRRTSARQKQSRSRSDVDLQTAATTPTTSHPPSPSPMLRLPVDGGLAPPEVAPAGPASPSPQHEELDPRMADLEQDPPNWREQAAADALKELSKKEMKRQEVINELFVTEHAHVRKLTVLQMVFARPMEREGLMTPEEVAAIFPGLDDIIELHNAFYENLKILRQEDGYIVKTIGPTLLNRFSGAEGEWFQKLTSRFCSHQTWALEQIKTRQKKDIRFNTFIQEAESRPQCRRLQLKDIIPIEMQRLTKYPLLLENVAKSTVDNDERQKVEQVAECCRKILNHVNEEVKSMENLLTLKDYQRRLDTSGLKPSNELYTEYKSIDLTARQMLFEGPLIWRVTKEKALEVQCVLLGDLLVLLQRQDDKMVLKCQSKSNVVQEGKQMLSPIIKLESAFLREVATDRKAFYVIFTWESGAQIYELVAQSSQERKNWTEMIKSAVDNFKTSGGPTLERGRFPSLVPGSGAGPCSPTTLHPPLSPAENGDSLKNSDRVKDLLSDEKGRDVHASLMDFLAANGIDPIGHSNSPQEKLASDMLDELMSLKRLLVGSISLSEDSQVDGENGGAGPEVQDEVDGCQAPASEEATSDGQRAEGGAEEGEMKREEEGGISTPMVLSQERMEEVQQRLESMEEKLRKLQGVEEEHHKLQELLAKFSLQRGNYQ
ncbi:rho guanine nucleotide exchange factor 1b isoform X3 [Alosa alosa]|uniref:rho guanine nucleotide exchange factor 1b isoform X3 n=1 Tax=Alosa alosa TaxID=278164 RepID=UPI0020153DFE|nr:rho guanine nucleotide exchange factor 1b isoform X3 [Alosa alosa]